MTDKPWLIFDEYACEVFANKAGLCALKEKLDIAINSDLPELEVDVDGVGVEKIILSEQDTYDEQFQEYEETWTDKLFGVFAIVWFLILPIVALILLAYLFVFNN